MLSFHAERKVGTKVDRENIASFAAQRTAPDTDATLGRGKKKEGWDEKEMERRRATASSHTHRTQSDKLSPANPTIRGGPRWPRYGRDGGKNSKDGSVLEDSPVVAWHPQPVGIGARAMGDRGPWRDGHRGSGARRHDSYDNILGIFNFPSDGQDQVPDVVEQCRALRVQLKMQGGYGVLGE